MISLLNVAPKDTLIEVSKDSVKVIDTNLDEDPSIKKIEE